MAQGVTVDFNANIARFTSAIDRATNDLNKFQTNSARISQNINKAFGALGVGLSVAGLGAFVQSSIDAADALNDLSVRTGLSVEALNGLQYAAKLGDTNMEALSVGVGRLNKAVGEAAAGNDKMAESLAELGITSKDPERALEQLADAVQAMPDPTRRAAELSKLLGKSYQELLPLLEGGGAALRAMADEGRRLNPVTAEMAANAAEFNDQLDALKTRVGGLGTAIAGPLVSALNDAAFNFEQAADSGSKFKAILIALGSLSISTFGGDASPQGILESQIKGKLAELKIQKDLIAEMQGRKEDGVGFLYYADDRIDSASNKIKQLLGELKPATAELEAMRRNNAKPQPKPKSSLESEFSTNKPKADKLDIIDPFGQARRAAEDAALRAQIDAQNEAFDALAEVRDYQIQQDERHAANLGSLRDAHLAILDPIQQYRDKLDEVQTLLDSGLLTPDQAVAANLYWQEQIDGAAGFGEEMKKVASESEIFFETMAKNVQSSLADFLFDPFSDGLDGLAKGFGDMLKRMAAEAIAADIAGAVFGKQSGKSGGGMLAGLFGGGGDQNLLGSFASLFGFANGGSFRVGGSGGTDSQLVAFKASPDERVTIQTPAQQRNNGGSQIINMTVVTQDAASFQKSRGQIQADLAMAVAGARRFS